MLRRRLIIAAFWLAKLCGLFALARQLTRRQLRILCYHGFALEDEDRFRGSLFVSRQFFARRMRYLARKRYPVVPLDEAMERLGDGSLPDAAVVITIDDGFHSTHAIARPILEEHGFPATLYLTSYYFEKGNPVFPLAIDYMFWKSPLKCADLSGLGIPGLPNARKVLLDRDGRVQASALVQSLGVSRATEAERVALCREVARRLAVDYDRIANKRILSLVSPHELRELEASGIRTGLHTHRHCFPENPVEARDEIDRNRSAVEPVIGRRMTDFCYPSGEWSTRHWPTLEAAGIRTATTCDSGLVNAGHKPMALPRVLDDHRVTMIEFEAEVSGFCEVLRRLGYSAQSHTVTASFACNFLADKFEPLLAV